MPDPSSTARRLLALVVVLGLALVVASVAAIVALTTGGGHPARAPRPAAPPPVVAPAPAPPPTAARAFTVAGDRAGFAAGYRLTETDDAAQVAAFLDHAAATGARWIRIDVEWSTVQEAGPQSFDWSGIDRVVAGARARGLSVVANAGFSPGWASVPGCHALHCAPADPQAYARFVAAGAARYGALGVHVWELWNEPNTAEFWQPRPSPTAYVALLRAAYPAIRAADPHAIVLSGGLAPAADRGADLSPSTFLRRVYDAGGGGSFDAVAVHPYAFPFAPTSPVPGNAFLGVPALHDLMVAHGDGSKLLWGTEAGAPTGVAAGGVTEAQQAEWVRQYYDTWNGWFFTGPLLWYTLVDDATGPDLIDHFGLYRPDWSPKPALGVFEDVIRRSALLPPGNP